MKKIKPILGVLVSDSIIEYFLNYDDAKFTTSEKVDIKDINKLCMKKYGSDVYRYRLLSFDDPIIKINFISPKRTIEFTCSVSHKLTKRKIWVYLLTKVKSKSRSKTYENLQHLQQ